VPDDDPERVVEQMRQYYCARAPWHDEYMGYEGNQAMEALLSPIVRRVESLLAGLAVLEVACGTGNWTQVLAPRVRSVLATDVSEETIRLARAKEYPPGVVSFRKLDAYALEGVGARFGGAFAADWWSHVPKSLLEAFLDGLHGCLRPGARVVFVDMLPGDHPDLVPYRYDPEGNAICRRTLPDGRTFDVVKNFPDRRDVLGVLSGRAELEEYEKWERLGRWLVSYVVPGTPGGSPSCAGGPWAG
jgi:demethylmenaquinone methyltransferase/2-methoxy-6-polyprenyl-1,4-benzoquinol methylase